MKHFINFTTFFLLVIASLVGTSMLSRCVKTEPGITIDSTTINPPPNHAWFCSSIETYQDQKSGETRAVGAIGKFWKTGQTIKIAFLDGSAGQIKMVMKHAAEWTESANLKFEYVGKGQPSDIRISFSNNGAWSVVGTQAKELAAHQATMNLGWQSPDVIQHEFGHALGLYHEHQNPEGGIDWNEPNVISDLSGPPNNWTIGQIKWNVLDKHSPNLVITTPWDKTSIMHYNIPGSWVMNGIAIPGGDVISAADKLFISKQYPGILDPVTKITLTEERITDLINTYNARLNEFDSTTARMRADNERWKKILGK